MHIYMHAEGMPLQDLIEVQLLQFLKYLFMYVHITHTNVIHFT